MIVPLLSSLTGIEMYLILKVDTMLLLSSKHRYKVVFRNMGMQIGARMECEMYLMMFVEKFVLHPHLHHPHLMMVLRHNPYNAACVSSKAKIGTRCGIGSRFGQASTCLASCGGLHHRGKWSMWC